MNRTNLLPIALSIVSPTAAFRSKWSAGLTARGAGRSFGSAGRARVKWGRSQAGQSLFVALGLLLAGGAVLFSMFSAGQVAAAKQRLTDTADASAYSAGLWRARVLNYHAYSNRAIIANEVAIAQAVTLVSWARYFETLTRNAAQFATIVPAAEAVLAGVAEAAALASQAAQVAAEIEVPARGAEAVGYKEILQTSQEILHLSTQSFGLSMVAAEVARANDRGLFAWVLPDPGQSWQTFTKRSETEADRQRLANLVVASLDGFTGGPRSDDILTPIPSLCFKLMRMRKRGGTALTPDLQRWEAVDTLSFHLQTLSFFRCRERESIPLGWGAAEAGNEMRSIVQTGNDVWINPRANGLASGAMTGVASYAGIARVRELDYEQLANAAFPTSGLAVVARQAGADVATAANRALASGGMLPLDHFAGDADPHLWALSAAEVYFSRPPGAPARTEYASLFNPYWQVRLVAPTAAQRGVAQAYVH